MPVIDKAAFEAAVKKARCAYRQHSTGDLPSRQMSLLAARAFRELNHLHERALIEATIARVTEELVSYQKQFGLTLTITRTIGYNRKGICRVEVVLSHPRVNGPTYSFNDVHLSVYIGRIQSWDQLATHTAQERAEWNVPSLYTKRHQKRWQTVETFDFAGLLAEMHAMVHEPYDPREEYDEIPF